MGSCTEYCVKKVVVFGAVLLAMVALVGAANPNMGIQQALKDRGYYHGTVDGIMGPGTKSALRLAQMEPLLAKFIQAEAGDQPHEVGVAIGAVAVNRLKHENFPNTLAGVIFQTDAFISVRDGRMKMAPTENALAAAAAALAGEDPTEGCLYFYNPGTENRKHMLDREPKNSIGRYRFCT